LHIRQGISKPGKRGRRPILIEIGQQHPGKIHTRLLGKQVCRGKPLVEPGTKELKFDLIISIAEEQTSITSIPVNKKWDLRKMQYQGRLTF
jgi:hypothetical protein